MLIIGIDPGSVSCGIGILKKEQNRLLHVHSEEDKLAVARARKIQKFLSQPFFVAEAFTGREGKYVSLKDTIRSFKEILDGQHDDLPEQSFYMKGTIEEVREDA